MLWHNARKSFAKRTNDIHWSVFALYFALAFLEAFPMTAFGAWLQFDLQMSVPDQSNFYASIFIPWTLKPLYGWISERLPIFGYRRKPYLIICAFLSATSWIVLSHFVTDNAGTYLVTIVRTMANAFAELLLGLILVDTAGRNMRNAGSLQAVATGSRSAASVIALLVGLPLYPCHGEQSAPNPRRIMLINGLIGLVAACLTFLVPDQKRTRNHRDRLDAQSSSFSTNDSTSTTDDDLRQPLLASSNAAGHEVRHQTRSSFPVLELFIPSILLFLVWSSCKDLMSHHHWLVFLYVVIAINVLVAGSMYATRGSRDMGLKDLAVVWPAVVLFTINAMPSAGDTMYSYRYMVWADHQCYVQTLSIVTSVSGLIFSWVYFFTLHNVQGQKLIKIYIVTNVISGLTTLLWWPWVQERILEDGLPSLGYAIFATVANGAIGQIALVSGLVIATQACPLDEQTGFAYALYISFMDVGDSVSGWVSAPIVKQLGITFTDFTNLSKLLVIDASTTAGATMAAPLLYFANFNLPSERNDDASAQDDPASTADNSGNDSSNSVVSGEA